MCVTVSQGYRKPEEPGALFPGTTKSKKDVPTPTQESRPKPKDKYDYKSHPR